jgi:starch synthase (maltosyl-transferring)
MHRIDAHLEGVRWAGEFTVDRMGRWCYTVEAWTDVFGTWRDELERKLAGGQHDLAGEMSEGVVLLKQAAEAAKNKTDRALIEHALVTLEDDEIPETAKHDAALGPELFEAVERAQPRHGKTTLDRPNYIEVDRIRARFGSWYEMFPRSWGGLKGVEAQLPELAELGFDVIYLPPIHPIGHTNRKGRDNALTAGPTDPGSPWAIGDESGGHEAVHKDLGTIEDLRSLTQAAAAHGIDVALDFAIQCSADHPWLKEHPEWFHRRPDGTLKYAENPPKRYQDIYNVNWDSPDWRGLWEALKEIMLQWVDCGVKVFRVDNPHTKPFEFWAWLIAEVHKHDRDVVFLAEAFTRRAVMRHLGKIGFSQSYTYFTWRNEKQEITDYLEELSTTAPRDFFRPHFFVNTPDINPPFLQTGGRGAHLIRAALAATTAGLWGVFQGFELCDATPLPGREEYLDSDKYEIRQRPTRAPGDIVDEITRLNAIRRANPALQGQRGIAFHNAFNDQVLWFRREDAERSNVLLVAINLDPHHAQEAVVELPLWEWGLPDSAALEAEDLMRGHRFTWTGKQQWMRLDPAGLPFGIWRVRPAGNVA